MKKHFSVLMIPVMALSLVFPAFAAEEAPEAEPVTVLYTNDVHTYIDKDLNYTLAAQYRDTLENVLLVDAGDHVQGTAYGSMDKGESIVSLMNAAGYDLATLGNHEFDYGMEGAMNAIEWAEFPYVSCNFYHEENGEKGENVLDSYEVFDIGGRKIAIIGITTPESFTKSTPAYFQDEDGNYIYGIAGGQDGSDLYDTVQEAIDEASAEADTVIALGHLGVDPASMPWTSEEVIANTTGLDAFIDGHSHTTLPMEEVEDAEGNPVVLTQTGSYFDALGQMTIAPDGTITTELLSGSDVKARLYDSYIGTLREGGSVAEDLEEDLYALEQAWITDVNEELGQVIGTTEDVLNNYEEDGTRLVRSQETNSGDFAADALYYLFDQTNVVDGYPVDMAIMNGGGIRNEAITGEISYLTCKNMHTFGNVACFIQVTGQQILDALEFGARGVGTGEEIGGFLHVSGAKYTIDTSVDSTVTMDDKGVFTGVAGDYRVKDVQILNHETGEYEALDPEATYNLAGYNYTLRDLGDGFSMFDGAVNIIDYVMEDYMVLANYVESFEDTDGDGLPNVTGYEELHGQGRITIE